MGALFVSTLAEFLLLIFSLRSFGAFASTAAIFLGVCFGTIGLAKIAKDGPAALPDFDKCEGFESRSFIRFSKLIEFLGESVSLVPTSELNPLSI